VFLFTAGVETSSTTFQWMLLFMAYHPKYQQKLRDEITREIGDKVPMVDDKPRLNYVMAYISEMLRFRTPVSIGSSHRAMVDCKLGN
jgi:cytochrome P450